VSPVQQVAAMLLASLLAWAQSDAIRVETTLVVAPVTVTDSSNRFVLGLEKSDFQIFEDGAEQVITHFSGEDAPLSIGLLVDTSGSMTMKLDTSRKAAEELVGALNAEDEAFLVGFSDHARLIQSFTNDPKRVRSSLGRLQSGGLTALLDAINLGLDEMKKARNPRKALIVISDGGDNNSRYTQQQIAGLVRAADVQVYAMGVFEPALFPGLSKEEVSGPKLMSQISEQTGGRAFGVSDSQQLPAIAEKIATELHNEYSLAYTPKRPDRDGKYRKIEVRLKPRKEFSDLKARWRLGYYAPAE
jgi:Ca-activated chloride channel family protein